MLRAGFSFGITSAALHPFFQRLYNPLHGGVDLFLAQGAVGGAQGNVEGHALLSRGNLLALVYVEQLNGFENLAAGGLNRFSRVSTGMLSSHRSAKSLVTAGNLGRGWYCFSGEAWVNSRSTSKVTA